jgi:signal transduction histidine kinase
MSKDTKRTKLHGLWPDSIFGQLMLALLACIIILQATNFQVVCSVQALYVRQAEKTRAENLAAYWFLFNTMATEQRAIALKYMTDARRPEQLREMIEFLPETPDWGPPATKQSAELAKLVHDSLMPGKKNAPIILARIPENATPSYSAFPTHLPVLETAVSLSDGTWLKVTQPLDVDDRFVVWLQRFFVLVESVVILALALFLLSRVIRPLSHLSRAAESFGKHPEISEPLPEKGSREIREAAQSFNHMRERICNNLAERGRMLAAMAHDLRTPLTRAQLRLDEVEPESLREKFGKNLDDIQSILNQGLELAGSLTTSEDFAPLNLEAFMQSIVDDSVSGGNKTTLAPSSPDIRTPIIVTARPLCLTRCVNNLVSNAIKYGGNAEIAISEDDRDVIIDILDNGPGIPEEKMEQVFEPYYRLETSRNRSSGGTGLGLSIARNMALLNGGELTINNRPQGGLQARVRLKRAAA